MLLFNLLLKNKIMRAFSWKKCNTINILHVNLLSAINKIWKNPHEITAPPSLIEMLHFHCKTLLLICKRIIIPLLYHIYNLYIYYSQKCALYALRYTSEHLNIIRFYCDVLVQFLKEKSRYLYKQMSLSYYQNCPYAFWHIQYGRIFPKYYVYGSEPSFEFLP